MSAIGTAAGSDDYVLFCEGLRQICGVDLSQYKRPQMERRLRAFFARKASTSSRTAWMGCAGTRPSSTPCWTA